jgi:HPt (histidine-containing phosphotransfer) domain-containing protein
MSRLSDETARPASEGSVQWTAAAEADPALDPQVYGDLCAVLGPDRMRDLLLKLEARLSRSFAVEDAAAIDRAELAREAHRLVSQSGALGFLELGRVCRDLEAACLGDAAVAGLLERARKARDRAIQEIARLTAASEQSAA